MPDLISVVISAGAAFGVALATLWLANRAGLSNVTSAYRLESDALAQALRQRVEHLEAENKRLTDRVAYLENELATALRELERLRRYVIKHSLDGDQGGA